MPVESYYLGTKVLNKLVSIIVFENLKMVIQSQKTVRQYPKQLGPDFR